MKVWAFELYPEYSATPKIRPSCIPPESHAVKRNWSRYNPADKDDFSIS
jgi:hypothetical protein